MDLCSALVEIFGKIIYSFTRSVTEHYNPNEPESSVSEEAFNGYELLEGTRLEWYCEPIDEFIYQEYSDSEITSLSYYQASCNQLGNPQFIDACSTTEENQELQQNAESDRAMAWKTLRPSFFRSICNSFCIGALISLLAAFVVGAVFLLISYLGNKTFHNCEFHPKKLIPVRLQWMRTISDICSCIFIYSWNITTILILFRPFQLKGVKCRLAFASCAVFVLDTAYRVALQALDISYSKISSVHKLPLNALYATSIILYAYLLMKHFHLRSWKRKIIFFLQIIMPTGFCFALAVVMASLVYPAYNEQGKTGKLLIAVFSPLVALLFKAMSRIIAHHLGDIHHPTSSFVILGPLYCGSAVIFRILQADLGNLESIAMLGVVHGVVEVVERSTMAFRDQIYYQLCKRTLATWGSFRTPRRERLIADIAIMSMLFESMAIVSVNGFVFLYEFIFLKKESVLKILHPFVVNTSTALIIEWFFVSVSLAIETHFQNMAVMAVWRRRWKRHFLVALVNVVPMAVWFSTNLLLFVRGRFPGELEKRPCKMPFT